MTMEEIITELYGNNWTNDDLKALEVTVKQVIEENKKRMYQKRITEEL